MFRSEQNLSDARKKGDDKFLEPQTTSFKWMEMVKHPIFSLVMIWFIIQFIANHLKL